jgi:hypothetical protein
MNKARSRKNPLPNYARYSSLAFQMMAVILAGVYAGVRIDKWSGFKFPVFTLVLSMFSVVLAIYLAIKDLLKK